MRYYADKLVCSDRPECWPSLPLASWQGTRDTLHMLTQIVGKVQLELTPLVNHWWNVAFHVSAHGLATHLIPYGDRAFETELDFVSHALVVRTSDARSRTIPLGPRPISEYYREYMAALRDLGFDVAIWHMPVEVPNPIPFDQDHIHASYDPDYAHRFWRALVSISEVLELFRSRFVGKSSPVHFFWGSFDLAVSRFSGRRAPPRTDPDPVLRRIMSEAYSHELISTGFWPGGGPVPDAAFYAYAAPEPPGFAQQRVRPAEAYYHPGIGEFILPYDEVRRAPSPAARLMEFLESTYEAGATTGKWDRAALEGPRAGGLTAPPP